MVVHRGSSGGRQEHICPSCVIYKVQFERRQKGSPLPRSYPSLADVCNERRLQGSFPVPCTAIIC